jgi:hypothetical protein
LFEKVGSDLEHQKVILAVICNFFENPFHFLMSHFTNEILGPIYVFTVVMLCLFRVSLSITSQSAVKCSSSGRYRRGCTPVRIGVNSVRLHAFHSQHST